MADYRFVHPGRTVYHLPARWFRAIWGRQDVILSRCHRQVSANRVRSTTARQMGLRPCQTCFPRPTTMSIHAAWEAT